MSEQEQGQWYTNKELFEQILSMQGEFRDLRSEMKETRTMIKKYNGLREEISEVKQKVDSMQYEQQGKSKVGKTIRDWGGWFFALVTLIVLLYQI